jgi:hypothetical protein
MRGQVWSVPTDSALVLRQWPGEAEVLVFHEPSGSLHLLTAVAGAVLSQLVSAARSTDELVSEIPGLQPVEAAEIVTSLERLGLITPERL